MSETPVLNARRFCKNGERIHMKTLLTIQFIFLMLATLVAVEMLCHIIIWKMTGKGGFNDPFLSGYKEIARRVRRNKARKATRAKAKQIAAEEEYLRYFCETCK